jgi:small subunit ribosomal protein S9
VTETPPDEPARDDDPALAPEDTPEAVEATEAEPAAPVEAEAAGDAGEASKVEVEEDERPAPPKRAQDPVSDAEPAPETQPLGPGEPEATQAEAIAAAEEELPDRPRERPAIPGADLVPDIVLDAPGVTGEDVDPYAPEDEDAASSTEEEPETPVRIESTIDLAAGARYPGKGYVTGKRKSAVARVYLRPGSGTYEITGVENKKVRDLVAFFPRATLRRQIQQPLETVGYEERMDVVAKIHGGGVSAQAGALRHGIARALLEADPNLRGELKRRGFLTRDSRVKERKKAGLKKARKKPQFSKR